MDADTTEQRKKELELAQSYESVFGREGNRNPHQKRVFDDLKGASGFLAPSIRRISDGSIDPYQTHYNDGCRMIFLRILTKLEIAADGVEPTTKVKVKR